MESHLLQMRGLKLYTRFFIAHLDKSHLLQMRGLKPDYVKVIILTPESHLLQMRGLKPKEYCDPHQLLSRIFYRCVD